MIKVDQIKLSVYENESKLKDIVAKKLRINSSDIKDYSILKKSVDARKKPDVYFVYSIVVTVASDLEKKIIAKLQRWITS